MRLVHNDRETLADDILHIPENDRKLLKRRHDDSLSVVNRRKQVFRVLFLIDHCDRSERRVETHHRSLQLLVQNAPVGNNDHRIENRLVVVRKKARKPIGDPSD